MKPIEQQILLYDDLPASEREEVDRYVEAHPEWAPLLAEARGLHTLLGTLPPAGAVPDALDIAQYVLARHLDRHPEATPLAPHYAVVEQALTENPALERQARAMAKALEQIAAEAEDPVAHFERLTGRRLEPIRREEKVIAPTFRLHRLQPLRLALAASLVLAVLYGALALVSRGLEPERAQVAALGDLPESYEGLRLRGEGAADRTADRYAAALDRLAAARSSVLGLFPSYDAAELDAVAADLREVIDASGEDSWEGLEALYVLGRIRLYQGRDEDAIWALQSVVALDGPHASDARRLLDYLQTEE